MSLTPPSFELRTLSPQVREKTVEVMFEKFGCPALYMARNSVLSAFATAKQTALVVDAGYNATTGEGERVRGKGWWCWLGSCECLC
jgi:hypothetical protein